MAAAVGGCSPSPAASPAEETRTPSPRFSVVVISCSVLRADHLGIFGGEPSLTQELDRFAAESSFHGRAIASSSDPLVALASLLTGVPPWQNQVLSPLHSRLQPGLPTLAELYAGAGFDTVLFSPRAMSAGHHGLERGFARSEPYYEIQAVHELARFDDFPRFYWLQLQDADLPWGAGPAGHLETAEVYAFADPARRPPAAKLELARTLYREQLAATDASIGRMLAALRSTPAWESSVVVVTGLVGFELGEHGQMAYAQNLGRETIEVPLLVKMPAGFPPRAAETSPVAAARLWATLAEVLGAGDAVAPVHAPSLFRADDQPPLSALYDYNGASYFSALFPEASGRALQVVWESRFAPPSDRFFEAQAALAGGPTALADPMAVLEAFRPHFENRAPLAGQTRLHGEIWQERGTLPLADAARLDELAGRLERSLQLFVDGDRAPLDQARLPQPAAEEKADASKGG